MNRFHVWACTSAVGCATSFITTAMPYLQFLAVCLSIAAALKAVFGSRKK